MKYLRLCNDFSVGIPLEICDTDFNFLYIDDFQEVEDFLGIIIPDDLKNDIISQQEKWEILFENIDPEIDNFNGYEYDIENIMNFAKEILIKLKNIINNEYVEILLFDELIQKNVVI